MANSGTAQSSSAHTLRTMYEAAWKEVIADPAAAVQKYQPDWMIGLPGSRHIGKALRGRKTACAPKR